MKRGKRFDLGVRAGHLLSMAGGNVAVEENRFLGVRDGKIEALGPWKAAYGKDCKQLLDGSAMACIPGLVNGHTHLPMTLLRGVEDDVPFHEWLFKLVLPLEKALVGRDYVRDGASLAALECIRFGVTTVNEMYFYAGETAKVLDQMGLRGIVSQCMASFPLPEDQDLGTDKFALFEGLRKRYSGHERIRIGLGPHAPYSCDDLLLRQVAECSERTGAPIHIHLSETKKEVDESIAKTGMTPVERLRKLGVLGPRAICAHCVFLEENDRKILKDSGASVVHNPDSNTKLASGIAPVADYIRRNIPLALGTDGAASNNDLSLWGAMDLGTKVQKLANSDCTAMGAEQALYMATLGGARALGLGEICGSLELGKRADFLLIDLNFPHLRPLHALVSHLVYSASGLEVDTTVCEGRVLMKGKRFQSGDPREIYRRADRWKGRVTKALRSL